jgi:outer membrane protein OmpA-like peptidoglycan-associated protein
MQQSQGNQAMLRLLGGGVLRKKLVVNAQGDAYEQEADRVADAIMRMTDSTVEAGKPTATSMKSTPRLQRCSCGASSGGDCEECSSKAVRRQCASTGSSLQLEAPPIVDDVLRSPGEPLDHATRSFMEKRFSTDFSNVRIHTDAKAAESANAVNALAYTAERQIVFGKSRFAPQSAEGQRLLAHELAHVLQQSHVPPASASLQRAEKEQPFPGGGRVEDVRPGEHLVWNFNIGQAALLPGHQAQIPRLATEIKAALARDPTATVDIEGQASPTGTHNDELSLHRAQAVRAALSAAGVAASSLNVISAGSLKALPSLTQENFARSRAVRVILPAHLVAPGGTPKQPGPQPQQGQCQGTLASDVTLDGGPVTRNFVNPVIKLQAGDGTAAAPAMVITGGAVTTPQGCGDLVFVQNVQPFRQIIYKDRTRNTFQSSGFVLDTQDPYPKQNFGKPPAVVSAANDSPSQSILFLSEPVVQTVEARDDFRMFVMFQPKGGSRQVLQIAEWSWVGQLKTDHPVKEPPAPDDFDTGTLSLDTSVSRVIPKQGKGRPTADTPVLSPNVTSINWVTNNAGDTTPNTFANIDRKVLDKLKPKADPK